MLLGSSNRAYNMARFSSHQYKLCHGTCVHCPATVPVMGESMHPTWAAWAFCSFIAAVVLASWENTVKGCQYCGLVCQVCHLVCQTVYCGHACMASCYQSFRGIQISERQNPQQKMHIDLVAWHVGLTTSRQLCEDVLSDARSIV